MFLKTSKNKSLSHKGLDATDRKLNKFKVAKEYSSETPQRHA